jgi:hypothetical protein
MGRLVEVADTKLYVEKERMAQDVSGAGQLPHDGPPVPGPHHQLTPARVAYAADAGSAVAAR